LESVSLTPVLDESLIAARIATRLTKTAARSLSKGKGCFQKKTSETCKHMRKTRRETEHVHHVVSSLPPAQSQIQAILQAPQLPKCIYSLNKAIGHGKTWKALWAMCNPTKFFFQQGSAALKCFWHKVGYVFAPFG
jgi:hypothetical protein